jgi:hypothetical protein
VFDACNSLGYIAWGRDTRRLVHAHAEVRNWLVVVSTDILDLNVCLRVTDIDKTWFWFCLAFWHRSYIVSYGMDDRFVTVPTLFAHPHLGVLVNPTVVDQLLKSWVILQIKHLLSLVRE